MNAGSTYNEGTLYPPEKPEVQPYEPPPDLDPGFEMPLPDHMQPRSFQIPGFNPFPWWDRRNPNIPMPANPWGWSTMIARMPAPDIPGSTPIPSTPPPPGTPAPVPQIPTGPQLMGASSGGGGYWGDFPTGTTANPGAGNYTIQKTPPGYAPQLVLTQAGKEYQDQRNVETRVRIMVQKIRNQVIGSFVWWYKDSLAANRADAAYEQRQEQSKEEFNSFFWEQRGNRIRNFWLGVAKLAGMLVAAWWIGGIVAGLVTVLGWQMMSLFVALGVILPYTGIGWPILNFLSGRMKNTPGFTLMNLNAWGRRILAIDVHPWMGYGVITPWFMWLHIHIGSLKHLPWSLYFGKLR